MTYMQRGNYVAVINPLFWSEVMSDDPTLQWGVYDTVTKTFFSLSKEASAATFSPLIHLKDLTVQRNGYLYATVYSTKRPIAAIVATSYQRLITHFYNHLIFALPAGVVIWLVANIRIGGVSLAVHFIDWSDPFATLFGLNGVILLAYIIAIPANEIVIPTILMLTVIHTGITGVGSGTGVMFEQIGRAHV